MSQSAIPVFIDLRSLQDPNYQFRGVGFHTSALLKYAFARLDGKVSLTGLIDEALGEIPEQHRCYLSSLRPHFNPNLTAGPTIFINPSPMTHDPVLTARFLRHGKVLSGAVVYDFIPFDRWGYFASEAEKSDYFGSLHWLKLHDHFFPISRYSAGRLQEICGVGRDRITVTGAPLRAAFYEGIHADQDHHELFNRESSGSSLPYFILVAGQEPRKNTETVIRALSKLNGQRAGVCRLKIIGHYTIDYQETLRTLYKAGDAAGIEFITGIDDKELAFLYRHATAAIAASYIEGFSLPIVEAIGCGCPVIASRCEAHAELICQKDALFPPNDVEALATKMMLLKDDSVHRTELAACQSVIKYQFHEQRVAERFWQSLLRFYELRFRKAPRHRRKSDAKPTVALLTPYPPDESGVAGYSRQTVLAAEKFLNINVYTNGVNPVRKVSADDRIAGSISIEPFLRNRYDAVISVSAILNFMRPSLICLKGSAVPVSCTTHDTHSFILNGWAKNDFFNWPVSFWDERRAFRSYTDGCWIRTSRPCSSSQSSRKQLR